MHVPIPLSPEQVINAERAAATAKQLANQAREQQVAVTAELQKQKEAAAALQEQLEAAAIEKTNVARQLAAAEKKVRCIAARCFCCALCFLLGDAQPRL